MKFTQLALVSAATLVAAQKHAHNHAHHHPARHGSPVEARDVIMVTETAAPPTTTVFDFDGKILDYSQVEEGLKKGLYVLVGGELTSASTEPATVVPTTSSTPAPSTSEAAKFFQKPSSSSSVEEPTSTYVAPTTSSTPAPEPTTSSKASAVASSSSSSSSSSSGTGDLGFEFESDKYKCSEFPSFAGPVYADWLPESNGGWTGFQQISGFTFGVSNFSPDDTSISSPSDGCTGGRYCSYSCPAGWKKSQWPFLQGAQGSSIGGLWCNSNGYLELTNEDTKQLCIQGKPGVNVQNNLGEGQNVAVCATDYPGKEDETIAQDVAPGATQPLFNPDQDTYYKWKPTPESTGLPTSSQYYINKSGLSASEACIWNTAKSDAGNFAPVNAGVGWADGVTYISLLPNSPTIDPSVVKLDYAVTITGANGKCSYADGVYTGDNGVSATGCTVAVTDGSTATFELNPR